MGFFASAKRAAANFARLAKKKSGPPPPLPTGHKEPLELGSALDGLESFDLSPFLGREYVGVDLAEDVLKAPNADAMIRDLAITISQRGVVVFRAQDALTDDLQKELVQKLGVLTGKPKTSGLHVHPIFNSQREISAPGDDETSIISSRLAKTLYSDVYHAYQLLDQQPLGKHEWHTTVAYEQLPSDYCLDRLVEMPKVGGDTLFASGYELYDRVSPRLRRFLDELTVAAEQPFYNEAARNNGFEVHPGPRGAPENAGRVLEAAHPLVRTNPVTGWKALWGVGHHIEYLHGLSDQESDLFLEWFLQVINENHDLQLRVRFSALNDVVIWDNRSVLNAPTSDFIFNDALGERRVARTVSIGERPYFDPASTSRREASRLKEQLDAATNGSKTAVNNDALPAKATVAPVKKSPFVGLAHKKIYADANTAIPAMIGVA